ncbi:MAG: phage portal protein [Bradyrhizobiaceae bacterium]|nr:phage portal protein [Bradyrhizobiaceae bacterium]
MAKPDRKPMPKAGEYKRRVTEGYERNPVVAACVSLRAGTLNEAPLGVLMPDESLSFTHPFAVLMRRPNPRMGWSEFMAFTSLYLDLGGNCYWVAQRNSVGSVTAYWPYNAGQMVPRYDESGVVQDYVYAVTGNRERIIDVDDVIHLKHPSYLNAMNANEGIAPIAVAWSDIETYNELMTSAYNLALSSGVPPGMFQAPQGSRPDTDEIKEGWLNRIFGNKRERLKPMVLTEGMAWVQMGLDPRSQQITEQVKTLETAICGIFRVDPTVVMTRAGMSVSTYNNKETAYREYTTLTRIPFWTAIAEQIEAGLYRTYPGIQLRFDTSNVAAMKSDPDALIYPLIAQYNANIITQNEAREAMGYVKAEDGDVYAADRIPPPPSFMSAGGEGEQREETATPIPPDYDCAVVERDADGKVSRVRWRDEYAQRAWDGVQQVQREAQSEMADASVAMIEGAFAITQSEVRGSKRANADWQKLIDTWLRATYTARNSLFKGVLNFALQSVGSDLGAVESSVDQLETSTQREVTAKVNESLGTLRKDISAVLEQNQGKSAADIAEALTTRLDNMKESRAKAIANTTTKAQTTRTQVDTWKTLNDGENKEEEQLVLVWLTQRDNKVRDSHERMDGKVIEIGGAFIFDDGTATQGPALGGSASNAINCRCTVQAVRRKKVQGY